MILSTNSTGGLTDPKVIEEHLMYRVRQELKRIVEKQNREHRSQRDAFNNLDRQIKSLNQSIGLHRESMNPVREARLEGSSDSQLGDTEIGMSISKKKSI